VTSLTSLRDGTKETRTEASEAKNQWVSDHVAPSRSCLTGASPQNWRARWIDALIRGFRKVCSPRLRRRPCPR